jgi:hypothetical protein
LSYAPYQNGKQEKFWDRVEGRVMEMLDGVKDLTFSELAGATAAWLEMEYNHAVHSETGESPIQRFTSGLNVGRPSPSLDALRGSFCVRRRRKQRDSDGTITIEGKRFEVPSRYESLDWVWVRYARWDLTRIELLDSKSRKPICRLYRQDKVANADGRRRLRHSPDGSGRTAVEATPPTERFPPLLRELMKRYAQTGLPPAYLPKDEVMEIGETGSEGEEK